MTGIELREYLDLRGRCPFADWLSGLRDVRARARIRTRLDRVSLGNMGDHTALGGGVFELRFHFGPGYRVYCARVDHRTVLLLFGGTKHSQAADVRRAKACWAEFRNRHHGKL